MLADCKAVAFVNVLDLDRARAFYEGDLGLTVLMQDGFAVMAEAGGVPVRIALAPERQAAPHTVLGFQVEDIAGKVQALKARGVTFERYAFLGEAQDGEGVWTAPSGAKVAWFKDPDGNLLSLAQMG